MVAEERQVWWLTETELDRWRQAQGDILAAENAHLYDDDDRQLVRSLYFHQWELLAEFYAAHGLDQARDIEINPATGCVTYVTYDVEMSE